MLYALFLNTSANSDMFWYSYLFAPQCPVVFQPPYFTLSIIQQPRSSPNPTLHKSHSLLIGQLDSWPGSRFVLFLWMLLAGTYTWVGTNWSWSYYPNSLLACFWLRNPKLILPSCLSFCIANSYMSICLQVATYENIIKTHRLLIG